MPLQAGVEMINFNFVGDTSSGYTHRLDTYMSLLFTNIAVSSTVPQNKDFISNILTTLAVEPKSRHGLLLSQNSKRWAN
jgi:hypothetical protein